MKIYTVRIWVDDWETACDFYEQKLGLPLKYKDAAIGWAEFDVSGPSLGIERVEPDDEEGKSLIGRFVGISLEVDDIQVAYSRLLAHGVDFVTEPAKQPWGGWLAHFKDSAGNTLTLLSAA